jgi:hypothetical protein
MDFKMLIYISQDFAALHPVLLLAGLSDLLFGELQMPGATPRQVKA